MMDGLQDPLAELRDIHLPPEPGWWPPALGWWLLSLLVLVVLTAVMRYVRKRRAQSFPRRWALRKLAQLRSREDEVGSSEIITELSTLVRRAALSRYPRDEVAGLVGADWLRFLDHSGDTDQFTNGPGRCLASAPYRTHDNVDVASLFGLVETWISRNA